MELTLQVCMVERMLWAGNLLNCLKDTLGESSCISCYLHYRNVRGKDILENCLSVLTSGGRKAVV